MHKIINDPVHGFITINDNLIAQLIEHPYFQRLRNIKQLALAHFVYPGAVHTRFHHALGAYHLMHLALQELKLKGTKINAKEEQAAKIAILLHDIGHGPFSHALEKVLIKNISHETISNLLIEDLNKIFKGKLDLAIAIFTNKYKRHFFHQLVSGQLDVDRLDYLTRDSYFTGVSEGNVGHDRILKMLVVKNDELLIEEKGIYSIEKFLVARRLMYGQAYMHKTVLASEQMLNKIITRARKVKAICDDPLFYFLNNTIKENDLKNDLNKFIQIDDSDIFYAIKKWQLHDDKILSILCKSLLNRNLFKVTMSSKKIDKKLIDIQINEIKTNFKLSISEAEELIISGQSDSKTYTNDYQPIKVLFKNGEIKDISEVDNALIHNDLIGTIKKYYFGYLKLGSLQK